MATESTPRCWPVNSPEPDVPTGFKVRATNDVTFRKTHWGRWLALAPKGDGNDYSWFEMNSERASEGGMELVEVPTDQPAESTPLAQRLVQAADDATFDPQGVRPHLDGRHGRAKAAAVAVLRELANDVELGTAGFWAGGPAHKAISHHSIRVLADSIEKGETRD